MTAVTQYQERLHWVLTVARQLDELLHDSSASLEAIYELERVFATAVDQFTDARTKLFVHAEALRIPAPDRRQ